MNNVFRGCMPALMTPCNNDFSPNFELLLIKAKELIDTGMSAVIYCGSMGDWPLLSDEQRQEGVSKLVNAGIPTIVGTGAINSKKDVDGFCPENVGNLILGLPTYISATPNGIMELLRRYEIETEGKHCVVLGRSNIVGSPIAILMSRNTTPGNATVTIAHSRTKKLKELCLSADILVVAIGRTEFVTADMVKQGAVVIDVGQTRVPDSSKKRGFRNVGDVDFENVKDKCSYITYVTGGVGPMTRASLLQNTLKAHQRR